MKFLSGHGLSYVDLKSTLLDSKCLMIKLGTKFTNKLFSVPVVRTFCFKKKISFHSYTLTARGAPCPVPVVSVDKEIRELRTG